MTPAESQVSRHRLWLGTKLGLRTLLEYAMCGGKRSPTGTELPALAFNTVSVLFVKLWKVQIATPPVATKVFLDEPPHSDAGGACA